MDLRQLLERQLPPGAKRRLRTAGVKTRAIADILRPGDYVILQSHMRAFTTLTAHILASNPEVTGYTELHRSYRHDGDLVMLRHQVTSVHGLGVRHGRYAFDKLLHNGNTVAGDVPGNDRVRQLFSLRHPDATVPSILKMVDDTGEQMAYSSPEGAVKYYVDRVWRLPTEARRGRHTLYFDAEAIVDDTDRLLQRLGTFLDLRAPLSSDYDTFRQTGREGAGDPSSNIKVGTIVRDRRHHDIEIDPELMDEARRAWFQARRQLLNVCKTTVTVRHPSAKST